MKANEHNFVELIKRRREEGIVYVMDTYGGLIHSIVRRRLFAAPDRIEECMNDIFLGIWRNIDSFDESRGSFGRWAAGVARLEAIDTLRKMRRESRLQTVPLEDMEIPQEDPELAEPERKELSAEAEAILNCLSEKDRELFRRIFLEEENAEEAGDALGISRDNVYVRIFRGKRKIRKQLKEKEEAGI